MIANLGYLIGIFLAIVLGAALVYFLMARKSRLIAQALESANKKLAAAEQQRDEAVAAAKATSEREALRFAALLNDLHEGVLVCNLRHQLVLYNQIALKMFQVGSDIGLGRPLFGLMAMEPIQHCLDMLARRSETSEIHLPFMSRTHDGSKLLQGRVSLLRSEGNPTGYIITFDDVTAQVTALSRRDALLRDIIEILRSPDKTPEARLDTALGHARQGYRNLLSGWWPMSDIHSGMLFEQVIARLKDAPFSVTQVGLPVWLHGDGHLLELAMDAMIRAVSVGTMVKSFDLSGEIKDGYAWVILRWVGPKVGPEMLHQWGLVPVSPALGGLTVKDVIAHHTQEPVIEDEQDGVVSLKLALPPARDLPDLADTDGRLQERPEFFDFNLLEQSQGEDLANISLRDLTYVVFDTETTGLRPSEGDRIVSIAGVRVVAGRILTGESFSRIVDPGRAIPPQSTKFHGLTDALVAGKPPIEVVLPQFKSFAANSVLVAHNAAFDLKFLRMFEQNAGVKFDNPVLDTMLIASYLDGKADGHSLDKLCERYHIANLERHTALGDSLATAALLLHQIEELEKQDIRTLGQALNQLNITLQLHQRGQAL
jgi:DNA polymerase-3 subunit epsilon